jgi:protein SCO1/2
MALLLNLLFLFSLAFGVLLPREEKVVGSVLPNFEVQGEDGSLKSLKELAQGKPLIINPIYTKCSSACPLMTQQLKRSLGNLDAVVLSLSFDPSDTPEDLRRFKDIHKLPKNWFVAKVGEEVFRALDFNYTYNGEFKEFDHPNVFYVLSPSLKVSRVLYGLSPSPRSLELATLEAKREEVGIGIFESFLLRCFRYNRETGNYQIDWFFLGDLVGGLLTFILVPTIVWGETIKRFINQKLLTFGK